MKFPVALVAAVLLTSSLFGQKQIDGAVIAELNFTPASEVPLAVEGMKMRFFTEDVFCFRVQLNLASSNVDSVLFQPGELSQGDVSNTEAVMQNDKSFAFSIAPGVEYHFDGADRLSPYVGTYLLWGTGSTTHSFETWSATDENTANDPNTWNNWSTIQRTPFSQFGLGIVTGADFYFTDFMYLGAEFGFVFDRMNYKDTETTFSSLRGYQITVNAQDPASVETPAPLTNGSTSSFGPSVNGAIRLGYCFGR